MLRNRSKALWVAGQRHVVPRCTRNPAVSVAARLLTSAQPLPSEEYEESREWKPRQYRKINSTKLAPPPPRSQPASLRAEPKMTMPQEVQNSLEMRPEENSFNSPAILEYMSDSKMPITSKLHIVTPEEDAPRGIWPIFRLMDEDGGLRDPSFDGLEYTRISNEKKENNGERRRDLEELRNFLRDVDAPFQAQEIEASDLLKSSENDYPDIASKNTLWRVYRQFVRLREMDTVLQNAQRQGRISFYMTCTGEEAIHFGAASALHPQDHILAQYREQGLLMWRGFTLDQFTNQCFSNDRDLGKGRQMPIHYGSRALNYHTISSPLGTQLPQAVGAAYRLKQMGKPNVAITFFGDGCASTTDFHSAMNFAATLKTPCIFFCRNNGYAISTPTKEQYAGDGIVARAPGYGMAAIRVDGNDLFAVNAAVREARKYALENSAPVLIEAITYRQGHHSTSDDSSSYRNIEEVKKIRSTEDPLQRFERFLMNYDWLNEEEIKAIQEEERMAVLDAIKQAEARPKPDMDEMFEDVYYEMPHHLKEQKAQLVEHLKKYSNYYK